LPYSLRDKSTLIVNALSKYKLLLQPLIFVLVLDVLLLFTNYMIAADLQASAVSINMAGRQRMLSQKITKEVALIQLQGHHPSTFQPQKKLVESLEGSVRLFHETVMAFYQGGEATKATGEKVIIDALDTADARLILNETREIWDPLYKQFSQLFETVLIPHMQYDGLMKSLDENNLVLLKLMNDLTNHLEAEAEKRTYFLRIFQTVVVIIILLSFIAAVYRFARREIYYGILMEKTTDVVISVDIRSGALSFVSASVHKMLGYHREMLIGNRVDVLMDKTSSADFMRLLDEVRRTGTLSQNRHEMVLIKADGSKIYADFVMSVNQSERGNSQELSADIRDISERKKAELKLENLALKDPLTGLANRHAFMSVMEHAQNKANRTQHKMAVLFIDLDGFKTVNDDYGHDAGDAVLIAMANRMQHCLRQADHISRMGGDEFMVLIEDVSQPYVYEGVQLRLTASIGVAMYPDDHQDIAELIKMADKAMYQAKHAGKNAVRFFNGTYSN
jgi:PAS domain S-box-containing protein